MSAVILLLLLRVLLLVKLLLLLLNSADGCLLLALGLDLSYEGDCEGTFSSPINTMEELDTILLIALRHFLIN
jgi:hypothetical protein